MRNSYTEEAWLFLNHLSAMMAFDILDEIYQAGQTSQISLDDFKAKLSRIYANKINGKWKLAKITKKRQNFCDLFGLKFDAVFNKINV